MNNIYIKIGFNVTNINIEIGLNVNLHIVDQGTASGGNMEISNRLNNLEEVSWYVKHIEESIQQMI